MATENPPPVATTNVATGLTSDDVEARLALHGPNTLPDAKRRGIARRALLAQFRDVMVILLLVAGAVAAFLGETADLAAIVIIVLLNAALGAAQEYARGTRARLPTRAGRTDWLGSGATAL